MSKLVNRLIEINDLEIREEEDNHYLTGVVMPFNSSYDSGEYIETFARGAFTKSLQERENRIPLLETHSRDKFPIGVSTEFENTNKGLIGTFQLAKTERGSEALELGKSFITGLSVGFLPIRSKTTHMNGRTHIKRLEIKLDHVAMVFNPAYEKARVLSVRDYDPTNPEIAPRLAKYAHLLKNQS